jgi:lysophospholipase L1-like esterase
MEHRSRTGIERIVAAAVCLLLVGTAGGQPIVRLGAIGDSLTDEYAEEGYGTYADAWTEIVIARRGLTMGPTAATAGVGFWGEPRRSGHEDNWARYAQTTDEAIGSGQHTGLAQGVTQRGVSHAAVYIGTNDWSPWRGAYGAMASGAWGQAEIDAHISSRIANMRTILNTLRAIGVKIVLANVPDHSIMPWTRGQVPSAAQRETAALGVGQYGSALRALADEYDVPLVDMYGLSRAIWGTNLAPRSSLTVGGVTVNINAQGVGATNGFVSDGVHPHTVIQGVWANVMLTAFDAGYATGVPVLSEEEIVVHAGLTYGGSNTLSGEIGSYRQYVLNFACRADVNADQRVSVQDIFDFLALWFASDPRADFNGQSGVGVQDIFDFLASFFSGAC